MIIKARDAECRAGMVATELALIARGKKNYLLDQTTTTRSKPKLRRNSPSQIGNLPVEPRTAQVG